MKLLLNADVYSPKPLGIKHLLIGGGQILWMGNDQPSLGSDLDVAITDLQGHRVIPGFIDLHAHITGGGGESGFSSRVPRVQPSAFTGAGVTTVVGLLGTDDITRNTRNLVAAAYGLREEGVSAFCYTGGYHLPPVTLTGSVESDIVFVDPIVGIGELALSDHRSSQPTLDEFLRVASQAHVAGMVTGKAGIVHCHMGDGDRHFDLIHRALDGSEIPARVFNPTHINRNPDLFAEAKALVKRGCFVDLTAFPPDPGDSARGADEALIALMDAGVSLDQITVSSDGGGCLPQFDDEKRIVSFDVGQPKEIASSLQRLLKKGVDLARVLPVFTANAARLLRLDRKGVVSVRGDADLLVLDQNHSLQSVMAMGEWHVKDGVQQRFGRFENQGRTNA